MSLGLVAYGSSDESDNDDISPPGTDPVVLLNKSTKESSSSIINSKPDSSMTNKHIEAANPYVFEDDDEEDVPSKINVLSMLPAPKVKIHELDIDVKKLKSSGTVRISIPSLSQLDNEESIEPPSRKKLKPSQKGSGLFSLLPSPKNQGLIPQSITRTPARLDKPKPPLKPRSVLNPAPTVKKTSLLTDYDDSGDEDAALNKEEDKIDFFSLDNDDEDLPFVPVPDPLEETSKVVEDEEKDNNVALKFSNDMRPTGWSRIKTTGESSVSYSNTPSYPNTEEFMAVETDDLELNDEALQQLCGRRDRNKMHGNNMQLIDVSGDAIMPDSREWLTKQLTEEKSNIVQSHKRKDGPTSQQRRKHQITYLAFQAKEHELELKNQWANNRVSRKQTQAKYGF